MEAPNYGKGHLRRPDRDHLMQLLHQRDRHRFVAAAAAPAPATWDSRALGWVGPIKNQEGCGACWDFTGTGIVEIAFNKAGLGGGPNTFILSEQYTICCYHNRGCRGDDSTTVLEWATSHGLPLAADYGVYTAVPCACNYRTSMTLYRPDTWGFADSSGRSNAVTSTADIKAAIMSYGSVGCTVAADTAFASFPGKAVFKGSGATQVDHDVILVGWDDNPPDAPGTGCWILRNSWGPNWCDEGYMRIAYLANSIGTEAVWAEKLPER